MPLRRATALVVLAAAVPLAFVTDRLVRDGVGFSMAQGTSGRVVLLAAGLAPALAGLLHLWRRPELSRGVVLLSLSGAGWLVAEWDNPATSSELVFTTGLLLWTVAPVLLTHAVLAYPAGRLRRWRDRLLVGVGYAVTVGLQGLATALVFDPSREGCSGCPSNLLAVADDPHWRELLDSWGVRAGSVWALAAALVLGVRLVRDGAARRRSTGLLLASALVGLAAVATYYVSNLGHGSLGSQPADRELWTVQGLALVGVAVAVVVDLVRQRRAHRAMTGLVVALSDGLAPGGLESLLAQRLGDPDARLYFPFAGPQPMGGLVDSTGRAVDVADLAGSRIELRHAGRHLGTVVHRPGALRGDHELSELVSAIHLGLDHERLQAQALAQLADLRESGRRLIDAGDAERRALERDLHDGAQQRLVGLSLGMRLLRSRGGAGESLDLAARQVQEAVEALRALGRGLYPVLLDDAGLGPAVRAVAETHELRVGSVPDQRFSRAVETTAYLLVVRACDAGPASVEMAVEDDGLRVRLVARAEPRAWGEVVDRVTTLGGRWSTSGAPPELRVDVWLPR